MLGDIAVANGTYTLHHKSNSGRSGRNGPSSPTSSSGFGADGCASTRSAPTLREDAAKRKKQSNNRKRPSTFPSSERATRARSKPRSHACIARLAISQQHFLGEEHAKNYLLANCAILLLAFAFEYFVARVALTVSRKDYGFSRTRLMGCRANYPTSRTLRSTRL